MTRIPVRLLRMIAIDEKIAAEIRWLNESGVPTVASCCGHDQSPPTALIKPSSVKKAGALGYEPMLQFSKDHESSGLFQIELGKLGTAVELREVGSQPYADCEFSSGLVVGHPHDTLYLKLEKDGTDDWFVLYLRPDEALAIIHLLSGALWSQEISNTVMDTLALEIL